MTRIISIVGPESCGKTTLARALAERLGASWVEEYARAYLTGRPDYDEADLEAIARGQLALEERALDGEPSVLVLDTDMLVIRIWWQERFGRVPDWIEAALRRQPPRAYLLTSPDLPWEPDPLREAQFDRERLFGVYRGVLEERGAAFGIVGGTEDARLRSALAALNRQGISPPVD
ncbi:MAG: ATP-binding protein [Gammaproteobacteria bacterium]|nr:ATP-binding protein [Gammaproteobacteria bacterium]